MASRSSESSVGIVATGYYIPAQTMSSEEIARLSKIPRYVLEEKIGMHRKHIAGEHDHPAQMGTNAALNALHNSGVAPDQIGVIAFCHLGYADYRLWSPAARVQHAIGAGNAFAFEVKNGCNSGNLGIHICRNILLADPSIRYAMVVAADRLSMLVPYEDTTSLSVFPFGDGAAAVILGRDFPGNRVLGYASITDGALVDYVKVPFGGTRNPPGGSHHHESDGYIRVTDPEGLDEIFQRTYLPRYLAVINQAIVKSGHLPGDISFLIMNQVKKSLALVLLKNLGLKPGQTILTMDEYGHMGPVDTLFGLAKALEDGLIQQGDLVVLAGSAIGFTWGANVVEFT